MAKNLIRKSNSVNQGRSFTSFQMFHTHTHLKTYTPDIIHNGSASRCPDQLCCAQGAMLREDTCLHMDGPFWPSFSSRLEEIDDYIQPNWSHVAPRCSLFIPAFLSIFAEPKNPSQAKEKLLPPISGMMLDWHSSLNMLDANWIELHRCIFCRPSTWV